MLRERPRSASGAPLLTFSPKSSLQAVLFFGARRSGPDRTTTHLERHFLQQRPATKHNDLNTARSKTSKFEATPLCFQTFDVCAEEVLSLQAASFGGAQLCTPRRTTAHLKM